MIILERGCLLLGQHTLSLTIALINNQHIKAVLLVTCTF